ncbi:MAG: hypothetical protein AAGG44_06380, partial [Planctomycetota bacterium]
MTKAGMSQRASRWQHVLPRPIAAALSSLVTTSTQWPPARYARLVSLRLRTTWKAILGVAIALAICAYFVSATVESPRREIFPYQFPEEAHWIAARGDRMAGAVFRTDFTLPPAKIARAWVAVAADNGFELIINANPVGRWSLYRATREFQNGHSEFGQRLRYEPGALRLNYPREYQWGDNKNWQLPMFLDVTRYLKAGEKNAFALTVQARHPNPKFVLHGEILLENGTRIPLNSHAGWKASYVPLGANDREWTERGFPISHWPEARRVEPRLDSMWRIPPYGIFEEPFLQNWRLAPQQGPAVFRTTWNIEDPEYEAAWLRVLSLGPYLLRINGKAVRPITGAGYHNAQGLWIAQPASRRAMTISPERVDTDEVGGAHVGENFLNPSHGDPVADDFQTAESNLDLSQDSSADKERHSLLNKAYENRPKSSNMSDAVKESLDTRLPKKLADRHAKPDLVGFDVSRFVVPGQNAIEIELVDNGQGFHMPAGRRIAVDAGILTQGRLEKHLDDQHPWTINGDESLAVMPP